MATKITADKIIEINRLYLAKGRVYAAVARELGISASTVKKYVDPDFVDIPTDIPKTTISPPPFEVARFKVLSKHDLFYLSPEEIEKLEEVRKEILIWNIYI